MKILCPYCGEEAREYHKPILKIMNPLLFLDPKYYCKKCEEHFRTPLKDGENPVPKNLTKTEKIFKKILKVLEIFIKLILIIFIIWIIVSVIIEVF